MKGSLVIAYLLVGLLGGWLPVVAHVARAAPPAASTDESDSLAFQTGVSVYYDANASDDEEAVARVLDRRAARHDTAVSLVVPYSQKRWDASSVAAPPDLTPSIEQLRFFIREAHTRNLAVMLKPLMDESSLAATGPAGMWRGTIWPADVDAWFASYGELMAGFAELAREEEIAWLVIGSEFNSLEAPRFQEHWMGLLDQLRATLKGSPVRLTYAQNWDMVSATPSWFSALDALSIDAYFPLLGVSDEASVDELVNALAMHEPVIEGLKAAFPDKPLFFTEVGIISQSNVYATPWRWSYSPTTPPNLEVQRKYFEAACTFYGRAGDGLFWWIVSLSSAPEPTMDNGFHFIGKPAEKEVDRCSRSHGA